MLYQLQI